MYENVDGWEGKGYVVDCEGLDGGIRIRIDSSLTYLSVCLSAV